MSALICGSLAYDTIMVFPDRFARHILPEQVHVLSVSFQIGEMRREFGGCAGNIAYNLQGLGGSPVVMATIGDDVITGSHVAILSGRAQHRFADLDQPMRSQHGEKQRLIIASNVWIGAQAVIMADVSEGTVIGAGSIVTKTYPPRSVIAGNPARVLRLRDDKPAEVEAP